jgi:hypothetical protein
MLYYKIYYDNNYVNIMNAIELPSFPVPLKKAGLRVSIKIPISEGVTRK